MTLSPEDCDNIRDACYHLAKCWDSLRAVEQEHLDLTIEVNDIQELTGRLDVPPDTAILTENEIREELQHKTRRLQTLQGGA